MLHLIWISAVFLWSGCLLASSEGGGHPPEAGHLNWYESLAQMLGGSGEFSVFLVGALCSFGVISLLGGLYYRHVEASLARKELNPESKASGIFFIEAALDFVYDTAKEQLGHHYKDFVPFLSGLFVYVLTNNLLGLIPGLPPVTENFSANLALGTICFLFYNYHGLKEHGPGYIKQFMGPFLILAPLFLVLEFISHVARPLSLAFRLTANIYGDHLVLGAFSGMAPLVVPALLTLFGLLVACIQSFVFTILTTIYISMAISHDH